jgi:D-specific alpha-keto acid dehydrogenase
MEKTGITVYGCERDEAEMFRRYSPRYGVEPVIIESMVSAENAALASGNRSISVNHKAEISRPTLMLSKITGLLIYRQEV